MGCKGSTGSGVVLCEGDFLAEVVEEVGGAKDAEHACERLRTSCLRLTCSSDAKS